MPHYVILSPFESPVVYTFFLLTWLSCLFCIWVSIYFYRAKKEPWWLLIAAAFLFPLIAEVSICLLHGLPPLPYSLVYPEQKLPSTPYPMDPQRQGGPMTGSETSFTASFSLAQWSFYPPMMAIALGWAYFADRKKRSDGLPTA